MVLSRAPATCYFVCPLGHGLFLRASGVRKVLPQPKPAGNAKFTGSTSSAKGGRPSGIGALKPRASIVPATLKGKSMAPPLTS